MAQINTRVCTTKGCCGERGVPCCGAVEESAWSHAYSWWTCSESNAMCSDVVCGMCCLPCVLGALASNTKECSCTSLAPYCPHDASGFATCCCFALCHGYCPLLAFFIEGTVVDANNNTETGAKSCCTTLPGTNFGSALLWSWGVCGTCAPCIIAEHSREVHSQRILG